MGIYFLIHLTNFYIESFLYVRTVIHEGYEEKQNKIPAPPNSMSCGRNQTAEGVKKPCVYPQCRPFHVSPRMDYLGAGKEKEAERKREREGKRKEMEGIQKQLTFLKM